MEIKTRNFDSKYKTLQTEVFDAEGPKIKTKQYSRMHWTKIAINIDGEVFSSSINPNRYVMPTTR